MADVAVQEGGLSVLVAGVAVRRYGLDVVVAGVAVGRCDLGVLVADVAVQEGGLSVLVAGVAVRRRGLGIVFDRRFLDATAGDQNGHQGGDDQGFDHGASWRNGGRKKWTRWLLSRMCSPSFLEPTHINSSVIQPGAISLWKKKHSPFQSLMILRIHPLTTRKAEIVHHKNIRIIKYSYLTLSSDRVVWLESRIKWKYGKHSVWLMKRCFQMSVVSWMIEERSWDEKIFLIFICIRITSVYHCGYLLGTSSFNWFLMYFSRASSLLSVVGNLYLKLI